MARVRRLDIPDGVFHVTVHGVDATAICRTDADYDRFVRLLTPVMKARGWRCYSLCVMSTHYHLVVESKITDLADGMETLNGRYAKLRLALDELGRLPLPLERARTLLALGSTQRQTRQRRSARETLEAALRLFEELGASLWSERTRAELGRISGRAPSHGELTPSERRVAELVAQGLTNREVAAALYVTQRTVEGTLSRVYGKLGHRSRAELGPTLAGVRPLTARSSKTGVSAA